MKQLLTGIVAATMTMVLFGCSSSSTDTQTKKPAGAMKGEIKVDGSSTVYLITEAVASNFKKQNPNVKISVGISGTGGGFKKFIKGETDISDASRAIKPKEAEDCKANGIEFIELQVAWDGLAVIVHPENTWARKMTVPQLKKMWHPDSQKAGINKWSQIDPSWPDQEFKLFGAGADSGTFDYFTEAINGKEKVCRTDYGASEDDHNTIKGVEGNKNALGFLGVAYYSQHKDKLGVVAIAEKEGAPYVEPTNEAVLNNRYRPLSRPLFIYVKKSSLRRPEVAEFCRYYLRRSDLVSEVKYVPMDDVQQATMQKRLEEALK